MRRIVWALLVVSAAVGLAMLMRFNHGNVAILWPPYRIDVSANLAVLIVLLAFVALHWLLVALSGAWRLPTRVREYRERRRRETALASLRDGLFALFEGRFGRAERLARNALVDPSLAGVASLVAARAAHRMREVERRDRWLDSARDEPGAWHAQLVTSAELALDDERPQDALAAIDTLRAGGSRHLHAMRLSLRAYEQSEDWPALLQTLRELEKRDALPPAAIRGLKIRAYRAIFGAPHADAALVQRLYASLAPDELAVDEIVEAAARAFVRVGRPEAAARAIERALEARFADGLVSLYAELDGVPARERLGVAERWRTRYGDDAVLLATLGRLCAAEELWGKAEEFLLLAEHAAPGAQAHLRLARLYEAMGRTDDANRRFRLAALSRAEAPPSSTS
ncbi:MAG TPA: heme biosynthesis HemY N-terminal domain-containing protein [Zeimonas sp.]|nr:heme biosynthesis HemY N-terminal domain-containing protein [Zeimonas sp.]